MNLGRLIPPIRGIGRRLVVFTLLFSAVITLIGTTVQLYLDYSRDVDLIHVRMNNIRRAHVASIQQALWTTDIELVELQLAGLSQLPDMAHVRVEHEGVILASVGEVVTTNTIEYEFELEHEHRSKVVPLGRLIAVASLDEAYARVESRVAVIVLTQFIKTFLVSSFMLLLFQWLVNRHLETMSSFARRLSPGRLDEPLALDRAAPARADELDEVVQAINEMRTNLQKSYRDLKAHQLTLEEDIEAATKHLQRAHDDLARYTQELEGRNRELREFNSIVSHDLKAPLRGIIGFGQLLEAGDFDDSQRAEYIGYMVSSARRMRVLVDDLLSLAKVSAEERPQLDVDLGDVIRTAQENLTAQLAESGGEVEFGDLPVVPGDRTQLGQLFQNLIGNALKFRHPDRAPVVRIRSELIGWKDVDGDRVRPADRYVRIEVDDNGIGFDAAHADRIFDVFARLHTDEIPGTGVGLAICRRVVERHGGAITARSVGAGACFIIVLPISGT